MIFRAHDDRVLARIESSLRRSDPALAAAFERFSCVTPDFPAGRRRPALVRRLLIAAALPAVLALAVWALVTGPGYPGSDRQCLAFTSAVCGAGPWACPAAVGVSPKTAAGARPCGSETRPPAGPG
jgi:hypothetical protein